MEWANAYVGSLILHCLVYKCGEILRSCVQILNLENSQLLSFVSQTFPIKLNKPPFHISVVSWEKWRSIHGKAKQNDKPWRCKYDVPGHLGLTACRSVFLQALAWAPSRGPCAGLWWTRPATRGQCRPFTGWRRARALERSQKGTWGPFVPSGEIKGMLDPLWIAYYVQPL